MIHPLRAWNSFWFGLTSARPLGAYRVVLGLILLMNLALLAPDVDTWLSDAGRLRGTEAAELAGPLRWSPLLTYQDPLTVRLVFAATVLVTVLFLLGWHTRIVAVLLYALMLSIHHRNIQTTSGADCLLVLMLFILMLSPCGACYSLDAVRDCRKRGVVVEPLVAKWPMRLIAIQISVIYFCTAVLKAQGKAWMDGSALYAILSNGEVRRFTLGLTSYPLVLNAMTLGAVVLEFALAFLLWSRAARPAMIALGVMLHAGIAMTINIPVFGELMVAGYLAFLSADEFDRLARAWPFGRDRRAAEPRATIRGRVDPGTPLGAIARRGEGDRVRSRSGRHPSA